MHVCTHTYRQNEPPAPKFSTEYFFPRAENEPLLKQHGNRLGKPISAIYIHITWLPRGNGRSAGVLRHWVKNRVPSEENRWVFFLPSLPLLPGSKSGIHVSPGFVLRCDRGQLWEVGPRGPHPGCPVSCPACPATWAGGLPSLITFCCFTFSYHHLKFSFPLFPPSSTASFFEGSTTSCPFIAGAEHTAVDQIS